MEKRVMGKWLHVVMLKFILKQKLKMLLNKKLPLKNIIPIFHHSIIPCVGHKYYTSKIPLCFR